MAGLCVRYGVCKATLHLWIRRGLFPAGIKLGPNTRVWRLQEDILPYEAAQAAASAV
jgi:hypothetical protein